MSWVFPDDMTRRATIERLFAMLLDRLWLEQDECYTTESGAGAAAWELPGRWKVGVLEQLQILPRFALLARRDTRRLLQSFFKLESGHPETEHYYLAFVGVVPDWQGRGIGAALLRPVLERCDRERMPVYLEASSPRNRNLYERHGFAVTEEFRLGKGSPPLWRMWRQPGVG
jgi:GNAT superfamily N-acetyltransferase